MDANQESKKSYPSLDLSFDWVKGVLDEQSHSVESLDTKAMTLFGVATAVLGIGASLGGNILDPGNILSFAFGGSSFIAYVFVIGFAIRALWIRGFNSLKNPITIREWYWEMKPTQFKTEILTHIEDAYTANQNKLDNKGRLVLYLIPAIGLEVAFLILFFWFGLL